MYISPRTFPDLFSTHRIKYIYYILDEMFVKITHLKAHLLEFRIGACKAQAHKQSATNLFIKIILHVFLCGDYGMPRTRFQFQPSSATKTRPELSFQGSYRVHWL